MDPDVLYQEVMRTAGEVVDFREDYGEPLVGLCHQLCDLDDWLRTGGYLPKPWRKGMPA